MKKYLTTLMALALCAGYANAIAIGAAGGKKSVARMIDSSGGPIMHADDKPWKVFEVANTATAAQLVDESGVAPKQGMVHRVCVETGSALAIIWDTAAAANVVAGVGGYRIMPPILASAAAVLCVDVNALFTSGIGIKNTTAVGSTYVYWRELGGYR